MNALELAKIALSPEHFSGSVESSSPTRLQRMALIAQDDEKTGDWVDAQLDAGNFEILDDVVRLGIGWDHDRLVDALDSDHGYAAAWLLSDADPDRLVDWVVECDSGKAILSALRAPACLGDPQFFELVLDIYSDIDDAKIERVLGGYLACMDPVRCAREMLGGVIDAGWLRSRNSMADFVYATGLNTWTPTLAYFDVADQSNPFELAAMLAVCAGTALVASDEETVAPIENYYREGEDPRVISSRPEFGMVAALDDEDALVELLTDVSAFEASLALELETPGVHGLPLLGGLDSDALEAALDLLDEAIGAEQSSDEQMVQTVQTLVDIRRQGPQIQQLDALQDVLDACGMLQSHRSKAICAAAAAAEVALGRDPAISVPEKFASMVLQPTVPMSDGLSGMVMLELSNSPDWMLEAWLNGPIERAEATADALRDRF